MKSIRIVSARRHFSACASFKPNIQPNNTHTRCSAQKPYAFTCHRFASSIQHPGRTKPKRDTWEQERTDPAAARRYRIHLVVGSSFAFFIGLYITTVYAGWKREIDKHVKSGNFLEQDADVSDRWRQLGRDYDDEVEWSEKFAFTNIKGKRRRLAGQAYGKVLEVSAGTGRNFEHYDLRPFDPTIPSARNIISSLTINDQSAVMLGSAEDKFLDMQQSSKTPFAGKVDFIVGDAGIRGVINRPEGGFDTIVQTMGICSMVDPVAFLKTMGRLCRQPGEASDTSRLQTGKDDGKGGRILLLEHGRSSLGFMNKVLDSGASMHADHYGCWWNKDIGNIIEQSDLFVEKIVRYHFGTTWEIHLRPRQAKEAS